jgi:hypothetical protein
MDFTKEQLIYCSDTCEIGKKQREYYLVLCESGFDAAIDMWHFVDECSKTCKKIHEVHNA